MTTKRSKDETVEFLQSPDDIIAHLTKAIATGNFAKFEAASASALVAFRTMTVWRPTTGDSDWYLKEWMAVKKLSQSRICQLSGWSAGKMHEIYHGSSQYRRETVNELADILDIEPFELLLHPTYCQWLRHLADVARTRPEGFAHL
jgi:hypothetical protein